MSTSKLELYCVLPGRALRRSPRVAAGRAKELQHPVAMGEGMNNSLRHHSRALVTSLAVGTCFLALAEPAAAEGSNSSGIIEVGGGVCYECFNTLIWK